MKSNKMFSIIRTKLVPKKHYWTNVESIHLFLPGPRGSGKLCLVECMFFESTRIFKRKSVNVYSDFDDDVHTIKTGTCAFRIGGFNYHSTLGLGKKLKKTYERLSFDKLNSYRGKIGSVKLNFDDEVSFMNYNMWSTVSHRWQDIKGVISLLVYF
ncbi:unnamed protein product [Didymodactylos carnosus]|uniref:Uncharacterized protein n=1 Tax=Didymodactylos carnosus TaxID=1234261 RepID=A0A814SRL1_9BILA|nr:unnamed protein product [Didymodactylos carnosus]CAF1151872.1 unnamed protein product [Didymodactylos carnosus]CAF3731571.1 unnamed protein product [Didymodactylos carnosus]CAF3915393.1 unnamed protein product [Didymodactylos carnosus]